MWNLIVSFFQDMESLTKELPNCEKQEIPSNYFNHFDFLMASNVKSLLHFDIINKINKHNNIPEISTTSTTTITVTPFTRDQITTQSTTSTTTEKPSTGFRVKYSLSLGLISCFILIHI